MDSAGNGFECNVGILFGSLSVTKRVRVILVRLGSTLESFGSHFGIIVGYAFVHFGVILGSFWYHFGSLGSHLGHFGPPGHPLAGET